MSDNEFEQIHVKVFSLMHEFLFFNDVQFEIF